MAEESKTYGQRLSGEAAAEYQSIFDEFSSDPVFTGKKNGEIFLEMARIANKARKDDSIKSATTLDVEGFDVAWQQLRDLYIAEGTARTMLKAEYEKKLQKKQEAFDSKLESYEVKIVELKTRVDELEKLEKDAQRALAHDAQQTATIESQIARIKELTDRAELYYNSYIKSKELEKKLEQAELKAELERTKAVSELEKKVAELQGELNALKQK